MNKPSNFKFSAASGLRLSQKLRRLRVQPEDRGLNRGIFGEFEGYDQDSFLAQKIEVRVTAGTRIDDGGKVSGNRKGVATIVLAKGEGEFEGRHRGANDGAVAPRLAEDGCFAAERRGNIRKDLPSRAKVALNGSTCPELQGRAFLVRYGVLIDAWVFSPKRGGNEEFAVRRDVTGHAAAVK